MIGEDKERRHGLRWRGWSGVVVLAGCAIATAAEPPGQSDALRTELKSYSCKIAYESYRDNTWDLFLMNADGSNPVNLTRTGDVD